MLVGHVGKILITVLLLFNYVGLLFICGLQIFMKGLL